MDDFKAAGAFGVGLGTVAVAGMIGWAVVNDRVLLYIVVIGVLVIVAVLSGAIYHHSRRSADEARRFKTADILSLATIENIGASARNAQAQLPAPGGNLLSQILTGVQAGEVVDAPVRYPDGEG